jgi:endo-1,4-beta-xylanase
MKNRKYLSMIISGLVVLLLLLSCKNRFTGMDDKTGTLQSVSSFPVGVAVGEDLLKDNMAYRNVVLKEYGSITPENAGKIESLHPQENVFDFSDCDTIVEFAIKHKKRVHGTTLIWHDFSDLRWLKNFHGDSAAWENMFKNHIQTVVTHYKGKVKSWDVVNEPFHEDGTLRMEEGTRGDNPGSIWARHLGKDYIARAFTYAHEADPDALLFLNDFDLQYSKFQKKIDAVVNLAKEFKERGIPIHGLGMQMHIGISANNDEIASGMRQLAATGLLVHISEVSILVSDWKRDTSLVFTDELQKKQSDKYQFIAQAYKQSVPPDQRYGITIWGVSDANSWIMGMFNLRDWPLPFDSQYRKKPAYTGFLTGLKEQ